MFNLMQGDCLDRMKEIPDGSVDMVLTDPPYGTTACKWDSIIPLEPMWEQLKRVIKPNGAIVLFGAEPFSSSLRISNLKNYKYDWIWEKEQGLGNLNAKKRPLVKTEQISVFYAKQPVYNAQMTQGKPYTIKRSKNNSEFLGKNGTKDGYVTENDGGRYPVNILKFNRPLRDRFHPTQKPVPLMEYLIKTYTNEGETVLDFTMGSGTTGVACVNTSRSFIGIELDEGYFETASKRIEDAKEKQA
jgi:site-specific DNA-methyltransferase (adenine-specific)